MIVNTLIMPDDVQEIAYDARQGYAKLVNMNMEMVFNSRVNQNFYSWFKALEDLKTLTLHHWKKKEEVLIVYNNKIKLIVELSNKYPQTWKNTNSQQEQIGLIESSLRDLEEFLYEQMKRGKIFGENQRVEELA